MKTKNHDFPTNQYIRRFYKKRQIVLHHTVSPSSSVLGDIAWWTKTSARIATSRIIGADGTVNVLFPPKYWAYHLYITAKGNKIPNFLKTRELDKILNRESIGLELDSAGGLKERNGKWYASYGRQIKESEITFYPNGYRGYEAFESYKERQIAATVQDIKNLSEQFEIRVKYNPNMWDVCEAALWGLSGLWSHTSYRSDKSDAHPQPELIKALKALG